MNKNKCKRGLARRLLVVGLAICAACTQALAVELETMLSTGVGYSDNIGRDQVTTIDEIFARAGMTVDVVEDSPTLILDIRSALTYQWYDETFDSEFVGGVDAYGSYTLIPERLVWTVEEDYGQVLSDVFLPSRPDNREDANYFSTGPEIDIPLGIRTSIGLDLEYSSVRFEDQPFDNDRRRALVSLSREVREGSFLSLNVLGERTEFDDAFAANNFDRYETYIRLDGERGRNIFSADVGYTEIDVQEGSSDGLLARFSVARQVSPLATLTISGGSRYSDQGNIFRFLQGLSRAPGQTIDVNGTATPFRNDFANVVYVADGERTGISFRVGWNGEDYEDRADLDREGLFADLFLERDLTRRIFANVDLRYTRREFSDVSRSDTDTFAGLLLGYRLNLAFNVTAQVGRFERNANVNTVEFTENFVFLGVNYIPRWGR